ncbi:MAG: tRNA 2-thiouridine(34) synthase MnmA [Candidatus Sungbacteria bacterium RIFCSPLOWO2_02_FULL_54_10]|uniref:tRNA-specific 2-thiouridylase MnmA n=1 Tax=Candidatus Sungbacteria bacterium RIFCSPHIGHO2_02_FULL_53_17 TaxID=1802275 RepID=A0A1G2KUY8_9BACT|nr:MAG: tRNA 2-thiouridine(34) synthase MnmA [Candidatus Sungbacteria bacterium RIFCSPHIGHO2_02_FULL_53_17]OHA13668.1 MAG: tRNA 2-thiouridine(34) synthase MnmA [Candidatus Sungbacteria bacterium RIFCSPLOWO2_02_FULL_54_10]
MESKQKTVFVGMSGGVDSSVAAALLKERGFDVIGVHIKMWSDPAIPCNFKEDRYDAMAAAEKIGIPFQTWDLTEEYRTAVVEYMIHEYAMGRTPNPDIMCNRHIKFGFFLKKALERGADYIATGHYVRKTQNIKHKTQSLRTAKDTNKDQSYFLWTLGQEELRHALFPIGEYTKPDVRDMARKMGLPTAEKKDSQGICFIGEIDLTAFLKKHIPEERGVVMTTAGRRVGEHDGLSFYTIGQREGIKSGGGGIPYYVAEKDFATNTLVVAEGPYDEKLFKDTMDITDVHWIAGTEPAFPLACTARIRYRQPLQSCIVNLQPVEAKTFASTTHNLQVIFAKSQRAVTPGQSIVFYQGEEMLGGGVIASARV